MFLTTALLLAVSLLLIIKGADWFIESAVSISEKSGIPKIIIGATIVSFATTAPEFAVSATAAFMNHTEMTIGNAVGSAICNIGLILGSIIIIKAIPIDLDSFLRKGAFMLLSGAVLILTTLDGILSRFDGVLLFLIFAGFMYYNYRLQTAIFKDDPNLKPDRSHMVGLKKDILFFVLGALCVVIGSRILVDTGITIAKMFGVPEMIIGLTLLALGTSLPELITAISATIKGHQDLSIGNILGANTMDIALILGVSSQIRPLPIIPQSISYDFPVMIFIMVILILFGITKKRFDRWEGAVILCSYLAYVAGLFLWYN
ncbi:MAG: calcium/sodium antiporter [Methanosarcinaceae archaeon]|nr:calcium/sodium antiporter [Methanosarcinaceae archaeon]MDF1533644.1 calcium/sodium antiporter [Methanosarcinaceae archaeon]